MKDRKSRDLSTSVVLLKRAARACSRLRIMLGLPEGELYSPYYALRGGVEMFFFPARRVLELDEGIPLPTEVVSLVAAAAWMEEDTAPHDNDFVPGEMLVLAQRVADLTPVLEGIIARAEYEGWDIAPYEPLPESWMKGKAYLDVVKNAARLLDAAERSSLRNLRVFGSVARGEEHEGSDVDFLVDGRDTGLMELWDFEDTAKAILGRHVQVVCDDKLVEAFRERIFQEAIAVEEETNAPG